MHPENSPLTSSTTSRPSKPTNPQQPQQEQRQFRRTKLPAPKPDTYEYNLNMWKGFLTHPTRLVNYMKYKRAERNPTVNYMPIKMDVENVSRCNLHCVMCQVSDWPKNKRAEDMPYEDFKSFIDAQPGLIEIKLQGMGEPLLGKQCYFNMIKYARSKHIWVRTTTNATLLHLDENYKQLIDTGVNEVQISIDGATKATYEKIRRGSKFEKVTENCKLINKYCNERDLLRTRMWTVLQKENIGEFFQFIELARELGFKRQSFALNLNAWGQDKWRAANDEVTVEDSISPEMAEEALRLGEKYGIDVGFWNITSKFSFQTKQRLCPWPFERAYISSDLKIVPCCMVANPSISDLGEAKDFKNQWFDGNFVEFRKAHIEGRIPNYCKGCYE